MCNFKPPLVSVAMAGFAGPELWNVELLRGPEAWFPHSVRRPCGPQEGDTL